MFVFHRVDDVYACRLDLMRILGALETARVPALLGVIPQRLTAEMADYLRARPQFAVYQHGVEHKSHAQSGSKDEFPATRPRADVARLIAEGRARIAAGIGRPVAGYIPPWNITARQTFEILAEQGFTHVSCKGSAHQDLKFKELPAAIDTLSNYAPLVARTPGEIHSLITAERQRAPLTPIGLVYHIKDLGEVAMAGLETVIADTAAMAPTAEAWLEFAGAR
jgi:hypothetical protein